MSKKNNNDKNSDKSKTRFWSKAGKIFRKGGKIVIVVGGFALEVISIVIKRKGNTSKDK